MPTYHYRCSACNHSFDQFQKFSEETLIECPECSGPIRRVPQAVGILFKGSGWYVNDSRDSKSKAAESTEKSDTGGKTDTAAKTEPSSSTKSETAKDTAKSETKKSPATAAAER